MVTKEEFRNEFISSSCFLNIRENIMKVFDVFYDFIADDFNFQGMKFANDFLEISPLKSFFFSTGYIPKDTSEIRAIGSLFSYLFKNKLGYTEITLGKNSFYVDGKRVTGSTFSK